MSEQVDYYELLQISPNAEPETIHRVYRLLAQRYHPDNRETGDAQKFRQLHDAYVTLTDPVKRAQFDVFHEKQRNDRWKLVAAGTAVRDRRRRREADAADRARSALHAPPRRAEQPWPL